MSGRAKAARHDGASQSEQASAPRLNAGLHRACLLQLGREWRTLNDQYLGARLRPPLFQLQPFRDRWGQWDPRSRTISISETLVFTYPWAAVIEVLRHEVAHQVVDELVQASWQPPHGPAFEQACEWLGIEPHVRLDPLALFRTEAKPHGERDAARLRKIKRLLALAESPNEHEAQAALAKANELLLRYNLDMAAADDAHERRYCVRTLGEVTMRRSRVQKLLGVIISKHFFCEAIWVPSYCPHTGREGRVLEILGSPDNVALAAYTYEELLRTAEQLWKKHKRAGGVRGDRGRRRYIEGVLFGFDEKLERERERMREEHALVWQGDPGLEAFVRRRHTRLHAEGLRLSGGSTFEAGRAQGQRLELRRAMPEQPAARTRGLALPGGG